MAASLSQDMEFAPFRSLDDFCVDTARFQMPPFKDLQRWTNRILNNLVYFQSNYFALILVVFLIVGLVHPKAMLLGFVAVAAASAVLAYATSKNPDAVQFKRDHPIVSLCIIVATGYFLVSVFASVVIFLFGIALPMLMMFIHASLRLRGLKNKIQNKLEAVGLKKTPMGHIFNALGVETELLSLNAAE